MKDKRNDNLPSWPGAAAVYSKAYRFLELMAKNGCVKVVKRVPRNKKFPTVCEPNQDMLDLIDALNRGDEEQIKYFFHLLPNYYSYLV